MKRLLILLLFFCTSVQAIGLIDLKFGRYQIADSQWNVSACMYTATCQIYSTSPGTAYKIPWTSGQLSWAQGDYVAFVKTGNTTNPYNAIQYSSNGQQKAVMGTGHIINMGNDFFFFVGNDNNTGQLFSMTSGLTGTGGYTWTGTLNPTIAQVDSYAANGSTTPLASGQTSAPSLCCGGSAQQFSASSTNVSQVNTFVNRTTNDSQVYIQQVGDNNTINVDQQGTKNNYAYISNTGSNNSLTVTQLGNSSTAVNYSYITVNGNTNSVGVTQSSTGGGKGSFINVANNNNSVTLSQTDSGSHYAEIGLTGGGKTVNVNQSGSASHMTSIQLSGNPTSMTLQQSGASQNFYSIQFNCATAGGCSPISVKQGN